MKILFDPNLLASLPGDWPTYAHELGHSLFYLNRAKVVEWFDRTTPDIAIIQGDLWEDPALEIALQKHARTKILYTDIPTAKAGEAYEENRLFRKTAHLTLPCSTSPLATSLNLLPYALSGERGQYRKEFACDVCFVGDFKEGYLPLLTPLCNSDLKVKIFGRGAYPYPQHLGHVKAELVKDAYASATISLDLDSSWSKIMEILAAGGIPVTGLDCCETFSQILFHIDWFKLFQTKPANAQDVVKLAKNLINASVFDYRGQIKDKHLAIHRLKEMIDYANNS